MFSSLPASISSEELVGELLSLPGWVPFFGLVVVASWGLGNQTRHGLWALAWALLAGRSWPFARERADTLDLVQSGWAVRPEASRVTRDLGRWGSLKGIKKREVNVHRNMHCGPKAA